MNSVKQQNHRVDPEVFQRILLRLTPMLRKSMVHLKRNEEQLLFLLTTITVCSSLLTRMKGLYDGRKTFMNLFLLVFAPPASGKGVMEGVRVLFNKIHSYLLINSQRSHKKYRDELAASMRNRTAPPDKPPFSIMFVPPRCTTAKLIEFVRDAGDDPLTMLATEGSEVQASMDSQHGGGLTEVVRKSAENETIGGAIKMNSEFIEVRNPKLSMAISGTPGQIVNLIGSAEDGTYSRFLVNFFQGSDEWKDVRSQGDQSFADILESQQDEFFAFWQFYRDRDVFFNLTDKQWDSLNEMFRDELNAASASKNEFAKGVVKRHGKHFFKMAGVLSALRMFYLNNTDNYVECSDDDFQIAMELISISLESSLEFLDQLPKPKIHLTPKGKRIEFSKKLKPNFSRADALMLGSEFNISDRSVDRWLATLEREGKIMRLEHNEYISLN